MICTNSTRKEAGYNNIQSHMKKPRGRPKKLLTADEMNKMVTKPMILKKEKTKSNSASQSKT